METNPPLYLPHVLIIQIFMRLPVKSLVRFKCVCKSWFSLISDPHFANSHFQLTAATPTHRILLLSTSASHESRSIDPEASSLDDDSASVSVNPNFMHSESYSRIGIKGSCRGFILLHCYSKRTRIYDFYIWNPSTGFHKKIPMFSSNLDFNFYGFGYDHSTDDYLLVSLAFAGIRWSNDVSSHLEIFSLRANAWEETVGTTHLPLCSNDSRDPRSSYPRVESLFNETIHWMAVRHDTYVNVIVAFHLTERKLLEIPLPVGIDHDSRDCDLWVFKGFLSLWVLKNHTADVDIWVMKEYKVHSSWSKTLVLTTDVIRYISPICCTKRGDIIGTDGGTGLVKYNVNGEFIENNSYGTRGFHLTMYTESLLSLPSYSEQA